MCEKTGKLNLEGFLKNTLLKHAKFDSIHNKNLKKQNHEKSRKIKCNKL